MSESKKYKKGIAISAALAVLLGASFSVYMWREKSAESPHYVDLACAVCHEKQDGTCTSADCTSCHPFGDTRAYLLLKADELELCTSCHSREGEIEVTNEEGVLVYVNLGVSHPFGVVPDEQNSPRNLPLKDGEIVCTTCHDVHISNYESRMLRMYTPGPLGGKADFTILCLDCHEDY